MQRRRDAIAAPFRDYVFCQAGSLSQDERRFCSSMIAIRWQPSLPGNGVTPNRSFPKSAVPALIKSPRVPLFRMLIDTDMRGTKDKGHLLTFGTKITCFTCFKPPSL